MMECWVTTGGGEKLTLPESVRWELCHGTGVPCDSFFVRCLWESGQERLLSGACRFYAQWEGERVFTGVVDEFACLCGADDFSARHYFKRAKHGLIEERAALNDDLVSHFGEVAHFYDLEQRVFDDGVGETRRDVSDRRALFLSLLDAAVHKDGATRAEIDGSL